MHLRLAALFLALAPALPASADIVHLANGRRFEDVVAERRAGEVRIAMPDGEIVLAARLVARIESSPSRWREYGARERRLASAGAPAADWLELAQWSDRIDFRRGMERAALRAAELEPELEGLEGLMRRLGRVYDPETGAWLSEKEYMERRGYLLWRGRWLPRAAYLVRLEEQRERVRRRREEARQERIALAIEALALAELGRAAEAEPGPRPAVGESVAGIRLPGFYAPYAPWVGGEPAAPAAARAAGEAPTPVEPPVRVRLGRPAPGRHLTSTD